MQSGNKKGFISIIIVFIIAFIALKYYFKFDILDFLAKYINAQNIKDFDSKVIFYYEKFLDFFIKVFNQYIKPFILKYV